VRLPRPPTDPLPLSAELRARYRQRISGPLLDRMDLVVEVAAPAFEELAAETVDGVREAELRARVDRALAAGTARQGARRNADLGADDLDRLAPLRAGARTLVDAAVRRRGLSARAVQSLRRVARTVADLEGSAEVAADHVAQALGMRAELG
jgi:magnesium chelatase family protein